MSARKPRPAPEPEPDQAAPTITLSHDEASGLWFAYLSPGDHKASSITLPRALRALAKVLEDREPDPV